MMEYLGLAPPNPSRKAGLAQPSFEMKALMAKSPRVNEHDNTSWDDSSAPGNNKTTSFFRQRQHTVSDLGGSSI
jgi:hypothetical protein